MSDVVPFPGAEPSPKSNPEIDEDKRHAAAFCDLEGEVCDLDRMGEIANKLITKCAAREDSYRDLELASFAVWQLAKMLREFKDRYDKRWHGEPVDEA